MIDYSVAYRVTKAVSGRFFVDTPDGIIPCVARKKIKSKSDILVGDEVYLEKADGETVVLSVKKRRNSLIRPAVANIDQIVMIISPVPEPDYFLVDKLILNCHAQGIECALCINKVDIDDLTEKVKFQYGNAVSNIVSVSATEGKIDELIPLLKGKTTCFAGQSAVGKSSLTNAIMGYELHEVGSVSERIQRGKNTTTTAALIKTEYGGYIVDTPGFSMLDVFDIDALDLDLYYEDYVTLSGECKYHRCTHTVEPGCEVRRQVEAGLISKERYDRYVILYNSIKNKKKF